MQEAENAFLYGMNGGQPTGGYAPRRDAYGRPTVENAPSGSSVPNAPGYPSEPGYPNEPNELSESSEPNAWGEPTDLNAPIEAPNMPNDPYPEDDEDDETAAITNVRADGADRPIDERYFRQADASEDEAEDSPAGPRRMSNTTTATRR